MSSPTLHLSAPAKINLFLHVTGKRADGYHELQSLVAFADCGDTLAFSPADGLRLDIQGPFAPQLGDGQDNLVRKAALALAEAYRMPPRAQITLTKNLPVAAGLGGGSSDAAAALLGLSRLWRLPEAPERLAQIALTLGADVPACLRRSPLWMEGIGEKMTPAPALPPLHLALANPLAPTPTAEVFRRFTGPFSPALPIMQSFSPDWLAACRNDLTAAAAAVTPQIGDVLATLNATTGCRLARMTGSGATCFGLYDSAGDAQKAATQIRRAHLHWWTAAATTLRAGPGRGETP